MAHNLVRLGYRHSEVMEMDAEEMEEWLEEARLYNARVDSDNG
jgi:hypothetical protein